MTSRFEPRWCTAASWVSRFTTCRWSARSSRGSTTSTFSGPTSSRPLGYQIVLTAGGKRIELHAAMTATWRPDWALEAFSDELALHIEFPPSYVHAGSGVTTIRTARRASVFGPESHNGYEGEWRDLAAIVRGEQKAPPTQALIDDLRFAIMLADAAAESVRCTDAKQAVA